jgi:hypothetical protein
MISTSDGGNGDRPLACCPECGAGVRTDAVRCWLCHRELGARDPYSPPAEIALVPGSGAAQFSLATILLVTTLVAVCLGVFRISPGFGVIVVVLATPALVRTIVAGTREKQRGHRLSVAEKIGTFVASFGVMILACVAGIAAFLAACFGTCGLATAMNSAGPDSAGPESEWLFITALVVSTAIGLFVVGLVIYAMRPGRRS